MLLVYVFIKYMIFCSELNRGGRGEAVVRALESHQFGVGSGLPMYAMYGLGTGHYLSPGVGGGRILGGITCFLGERKGGSVVTENPKGEVTDNFGRIQREDHSNLLGK